ncbi:MAG: adenylate/guanylate cyclase domain-containing protein [Candidatus Binatia bacterium]|nr:adenylate/guanylate cyclase domain-containing protein [Candidatus Binatia bacterium]
MTALALAAVRIAGCGQLGLLEERITDYRLNARGGGGPPHPDIRIVAIDDASIEQLGRWPWPRNVVATLLRKIAAANPRVVAIDIVQSEPSLHPGGEAEDGALVQALAESPLFVLGYFFDFERPAPSALSELVRPYDFVRVQSPLGLERLPPRGVQIPTLTPNLLPLTRTAKDLGYFNLIPDGDGTIRRAALVVRYGDQLVPPLSIAALRQATGRRARVQVNGTGVAELALGNQRLPVDRMGALRIDFRGAGQTFPHISAADLLRDRVAPDGLRDKIVLVGVTATGVYDQRVTPFDPAFPGVEIHANVIDNVLQNRFLIDPWWGGLAEALAWLALASMIGWLVVRLRGLTGALTAVSIVGLYGLGCEVLLRRHGLVVPVLWPTLAAVLALISGTVHRYLWEERERRKIRRALELYLSPAAAQLVSEHPERLKLGGEKVECSVLFSDVKDFTSLSEQLAPEVLVVLLNSYLGAMTDVVFAHEGMLDKYIGDGVMAVWGVPLPQLDHAAKACRAALAMQDRVQHLRAKWRSKGWPELQVRIGINSGPVVFGNMGSTEHLSLTVVGDNVNLAARLEGLNKIYGTRILLTEATAQALGDQFLIREIDTVRVKGREQPVRIFELMAEGEAALDEGKRAACRQFELALSAYRRGEFQRAAEEFALLANGPTSDPAARFFLLRCRALLQNRPREWAAITELDEK